jgi:hypothetical protein
MILAGSPASRSTSVAVLGAVGAGRTSGDAVGSSSRADGAGLKADGPSVPWPRRARLLVALSSPHRTPSPRRAFRRTFPPLPSPVAPRPLTRSAARLPSRRGRRWHDRADQRARGPTGGPVLGLLLGHDQGASARLPRARGLSHSRRLATALCLSRCLALSLGVSSHAAHTRARRAARTSPPTPSSSATRRGWGSDADLCAAWAARCADGAASTQGILRRK